MRVRGGPVALLIGALALAGCKTTIGGSEQPVTTQPEGAASTDTYEPAPTPDIKVGERPDPSSDEGGLWLISDRSEAGLKTAGNRIDDPELNEYIHGLVCRVSGPYCPDIRVYVMRQPDFNAFMSPNGMMVVWSGLLLRARNEAQLATVLGHEVGHYLRRHGVERWRRIVNTTGFLTFFSMAVGAAGAAPLGDLAALAAIGGISSYSRDNEREADEIGVERIAESGYDPREAAKIWQNLIEEMDRGEVKRDFSFFLSSHPRPEERQETLMTRANKIIERRGSAGEVGVERYRKIIAPHRFSMLRDEVRKRDYDRNLALIEMLIEDGFRLGELHFFRGEVHRFRDDDEKGDRDKALEAYEQAKAHADAPVELHRSIGLLNVRLGRNREAAVALRKYLDLRPDAPDAAFLLNYIKPTS